MKHKRKVAAFLVCSGACMSLFMNCTPNYSFSNPVQDSASAAGTGSTPVICSPFSGGQTGSSGAISSVTYISPQSPVIAKGVDVASFAVGQPDVQVLPYDVLLNQFDVPTQAFTDGFTLANGSVVLDSSGNPLVQYFALHSTGGIALAPSPGVSAAGYYQFAVLSDDGSIFSATDPSGDVTVVNNDGTHSNRFACSPTAANMQPGAPLTFQMDYYQGPPVSLGLILLWRPVDPSNPKTLQDSFCGETEGDDYFFQADANKTPQPTSNFAAILSHGWSIVPSANFVLPAGTTNSCN